MDRPQPPPDESARAALAQAFRHADLSLDELWLRYFAVGGNLDPVDLEAYLVGLAPVPAVEHDMLALTVNERLDELRGRHEVPYSHVVRPRRPTTWPLAALVQALELGPLAPPERLAALVATAGRALGVGVVVHLVDDEQRLLRRLSPGGGAE